jgi:hypothetical protein
MENQQTCENPGSSAALTDRVAHDNARLQRNVVSQSCLAGPVCTAFARDQVSLLSWTGWQKAVNRQRCIKVHTYPEGRPGPLGPIGAALDEVVLQGIVAAHGIITSVSGIQACTRHNSTCHMCNVMPGRVCCGICSRGQRAEAADRTH